MKRTKSPKAPVGQEQFIKKGKGMLRLKSGVVVKENEVFFAYPEDIPDAFRDTIVPTNPDETVKKTFKKHGIVEDKIPVYKKVKTELTEEEVKAYTKEGKDVPVLYNIVDKQNKVVNEEPLEKEEADLLLKDLNPK